MCIMWSPYYLMFMWVTWYLCLWLDVSVYQFADHEYTWCWLIFLVVPLVKIWCWMFNVMMFSSLMFMTCHNSMIIFRNISFTGCVQELLLNRKSLFMDRASGSELGHDPPTAKPGCSREITCREEICGAHGECQSAWDNYTCQCSDDYVGEHCQQGMYT